MKCEMYIKMTLAKDNDRKNKIIREANSLLEKQSRSEVNYNIIKKV